MEYRPLGPVLQPSHEQLEEVDADCDLGAEDGEAHDEDDCFGLEGYAPY